MLNLEAEIRYLKLGVVNTVLAPISICGFFWNCWAPGCFHWQFISVGGCLPAPANNRQ